MTWGTDMTTTVTVRRGNGLRVHGPDRFDSIGDGAARGLRPRNVHGSSYLAAHSGEVERRIRGT